ncbi:Putative LOC100889892, partial [Caligus rogercresseyi]
LPNLQFIQPGKGGTESLLSGLRLYKDRLKTKLRTHNGSHRHRFPSYLNELMWFERHGMNPHEAFESILRDTTLNMVREAIENIECR